MVIDGLRGSAHPRWVPCQTALELFDFRVKGLINKSKWKAKTACWHVSERKAQASHRYHAADFRRSIYTEGR
jgi:hypothetical protein